MMPTTMMINITTSVHLTLQLPEGDQRSSEGDAADEGAKEEEGLDDAGRGVGGEMGLLQDVVGEAGQHGRHTHQRVEKGHHLGKVRHLHALGDHTAEGAPC